MNSKAATSDAPASAQESRNKADKIVICGLGSLGLQCAALLKEFGVDVIGVDAAPPPAGVDQGALDQIVIGDCSRSEVLKRAGVAACRAVLIMTTDERSNIAAAFAARRVNPGARLIIRSAQQKLNRLLAERLGNLVAVEPHEFSARAFAVASLGDSTKAKFDLNGTKVQVVTHVVQQGDWRRGRVTADLNSLNRRVIGHVAGGRTLVDMFALQGSDAAIQAGDILTFIECGDVLKEERSTHSKEKKTKRVDFAALAQNALSWLKAAPKAAFVSLLIVLGLAAGGILLYRAENPDISWFDAINVSTVLAVGGFDNVFGSLKAPFPISPGLYAYSLLTKISSAIFLGIVFATFTERILGARFQIAARRPKAPTEDHTIIVGMGPIGQNIAAMLQKWGLPAVGISEQPIAEDVLRNLPIKFGPVQDVLTRVNIASARSVVVVGDDQVANLETALLARSLNPNCALVFRAADPDLAASVAALIPDSMGISEYDLAAQAIAGAAFDETMLTAFQLAGRYVLVTQYIVMPGDTLIDRQLAHMAYGYGAVPILHERGLAGQLNPSDDIRLEAGDRLVVLATVDTLRRIEHGELAPPQWRLVIESCPSSDSAFEAGNSISRIAGCDLSFARKAFSGLPRELDIPFYRQQGVRLVRELAKVKVVARLVGG